MDKKESGVQLDVTTGPLSLVVTRDDNIPVSVVVMLGNVPLPEGRRDTELM